MKKFVILLLVVCLLFAGFVSWQTVDFKKPVVENEADEQQTQQETVQANIRSLNAEKLYAAYAPEQVVMTVNGQDVTWKDFFYFINSNAASVSSYFANMQAYGMTADWEDELEAGETYQDYVVNYAREIILQLIAIEGFADKNGAGISPENQQAIDAETEAIKTAAFGEGASDEQFEEYLSQMYMNAELYERMAKVNYLYQNGFTAVYGENGAFVTEEDAMAYLEDKGYMSANHILYLTTDMATGEELDAAALEDKQAAAGQMSEYLRTLEVEDEAELVARFEELKAEQCEDTGKTAYPSGYVFLPGTMVTEFEDATKALADYEVSEPVKSPYGYHVIIRLPLDVDAVVEYSSDGTPLTARSLFANEQYANNMQEYHDSLEIKMAPEFENFSIADYLE